MNKVLEQIFSHRSIRKFKKQEIEQEKIDLILKAASMASSSGNMQAYSIILTRSEEVKLAMKEAHFHQNMLMDAPYFLTFCGDFNRMRKWLAINQAPNNFNNFMSFMISSIDGILASQNAALAAESLGLGICYMGTTLASAKEIGKVLNLPKNVVPVVGFALGYPDESPEIRKRLPLEGLIHQEIYDDYTKETINSIYQQRNEEGLRRYKQKFQEDMDKRNITNLAQVYTRLKYTEESHLKYSEELLGYLKEQDFV